MTKVGLAIADKSVLKRGNYGALRQILGLATLRPRGMKTTRPNSAARAKELGENKGVADNGLTNTNNNILTTNDDPR